MSTTCRDVPQGKLDAVEEGDAVCKGVAQVLKVARCERFWQMNIICARCGAANGIMTGQVHLSAALERCRECCMARFSVGTAAWQGHQQLHNHADNGACKRRCIFDSTWHWKYPPGLA